MTRAELFSQTSKNLPFSGCSGLRSWIVDRFPYSFAFRSWSDILSFAKVQLYRETADFAVAYKQKLPSLKRLGPERGGEILRKSIRDHIQLIFSLLLDASGGDIGNTYKGFMQKAFFWNHNFDSITVAPLWSRFCFALLGVSEKIGWFSRLWFEMLLCLIFNWFLTSWKRFVPISFRKKSGMGEVPKTYSYVVGCNPGWIWWGTFEK